MSTELQVQASKVQMQNPVEKLLASNFKAIQSILKDPADTARFVRMACNEIWADENLRNCSPDSIMQSLFDIAASRLYVSKALGHVYLIGYAGKCTMQYGYKGLITLGCRNPLVQSFTAETVHEGDEFDYLEGTGGFVRLKKSLVPGRKDRPRTASYSAVTFNNGGTNVKVMPWDEVEAIRNSSNAWKSGKAKAMAFWKDHPDAMGAKTAIRAHAKFLSIGDDFQSAVEKDIRNYSQLEDEIENEHSLPYPKKAIMERGSQLENAEGFIVEVTSEKKAGKKGKPDYNLYYVTLDNARKFGTFNDEHADRARKIKEQGEPCLIEYRMDEYGARILNIEQTEIHAE